MIGNTPSDHSSIDLEKQDRRSDGEKETSTEGSPDMSLVSTAELTTAAKAELDALSRIESTTSVFDPASRVPTNASRESGIIGMLPKAPLLSGCLLLRMEANIHRVGWRTRPCKPEKLGAVEKRRCRRHYLRHHLLLASRIFHVCARNTYRHD